MFKTEENFCFAVAYLTGEMFTNPGRNVGADHEDIIIIVATVTVTHIIDDNAAAVDHFTSLSVNSELE